MSFPVSVFVLLVSVLSVSQSLSSPPPSSSSSPSLGGGQWSEWEETPCSATCGVSMAKKTRKCKDGAKCFGLAELPVFCPFKAVCPFNAPTATPKASTTPVGHKKDASSTPLFGLMDDGNTPFFGYLDDEEDFTTTPTARPFPSFQKPFHPFQSVQHQVEQSSSTSPSTTSKPSSPFGEWSEWSEASCSASCGVSVSKKTRTCKDGKKCIGLAELPVVCPFKAVCPINSHFGASSSSKSPLDQPHLTTTSTPTVQKQVDQPSSPTSDQVTPGSSTTLRTGVAKKMGKWSAWKTGPCSKTCGGGMQERSRQCEGGGRCFGLDKLRLPCPFKAC